MKTIQTLLLISLLLSFMLVVWAQENENCTLVGRWAHGPCYAMDAMEDIFYFGNGGYLRIVDLSDPANPVQPLKIG